MTNRLTDKQVAEITERSIKFEADYCEHQLPPHNPLHTDRKLLLRDRDALLVELEAAKRDAAFYRSCALSGEVPKAGSEPSAILKQDDDES